MLSTLPLKQLIDLRGVARFYNDWLSHPAEDPWWDWVELRNKYGRVHAAVLNFSGWYDDNYGPEGATTNFNGLVAGGKRITLPINKRPPPPFLFFFSFPPIGVPPAPQMYFIRISITSGPA